MWTVETHNLTKIYGNRHIALGGVSLRVDSGTVLGLLGPNGAGKTTLIRLILGLHRPSAGWVEVFGRAMKPNAARLRSRIGYLPAEPHFPPQMTPITYLDHIGKLFGLGAEQRRPRLGSLIRAVDLLGASSQTLGGLSTGQLTRLAIAASLINDPELLVWDEPTHGLDPEARRQTIDLMKELARDRTLILSSHLLQDVDEVCDYVAVLNRGELIFYGSIPELKGRMGQNRIELYLDAKPKAVESVRANLLKLSGVRSANAIGSRLELHLAEGPARVGTLAEVFMSIAEANLSVVSIQTAGHQTEEAFLELVESDQARGFTRATGRRSA